MEKFVKMTKRLGRGLMNFENRSKAKGGHEICAKARIILSSITVRMVTKEKGHVTFRFRKNKGPFFSFTHFAIKR